MSAVSLTIASPIDSPVAPQRLVFADREDIPAALDAFDQDSCPDDSCPDDLWLDFSQITMIGSEELSHLIRFCVHLRQSGVRIHATNVSPLLEEVFEVTRFAKRQ
ncbi:MAG: hypothetical protein QGG36_22475 [Pirellulaceae bacterium]|jgi:hypothetical protein|nr:hypothetical protein [Pirellulaceae bacterium]MDP7018581.1 hypothetical protein [Pirellulaceae bacterium]